MRSLRLDLAAWIGLIVSILLVIFAPIPLSVVGGLGLAFVLPGVSLLCVVWTRFPLTGFERFLVVLATSVAITIFSGLIVDALGMRLTKESWCGALAIASGGLLVAAFAIEGQYAHRLPTVVHWSIPKRWATLAVSGAIVMATAAIAIAVAGSSKEQTLFTQLWILRAAGTTPAIELGVESYEQHTTTYRLVVKTSQSPPQTTLFTLNPGQKWQKSQPVPTSKERVDVTLYRLPNKSVYRYVRLAD